MKNAIFEAVESFCILCCAGTRRFKGPVNKKFIIRLGLENLLFLVYFIFCFFIILIVSKKKKIENKKTKASD